MRRAFFFLVMVGLSFPTAVFAASEGGGHASLGEILPLWSVIPFAGILLSIAVFPLINGHWWHHNFGKVSAAWSVLFAIPFLIVYKGAAFHEILHIYLADYIPFIILLWGLFVAGGGIVIRGTLAGTPVVNTAILLLGTLLASWMGTTGASMILIRPLLRANATRKSKVHVVVFFIFLVSNIGGSLTPLGDPPLFLGFLHGVPFFWTMSLLPEMAMVSGILLALFFALDTMYYNRERTELEAAEVVEKEPLRIDGLYNLIFLGGIMGAVLMSGIWNPHIEVNILGVHVALQSICRDLLIVLMGVLSLKFTPWSLRKANEFDWFPIKEVGYLFAGIFMTIVPALAILKAGEHGALAFVIAATKGDASYFWITGILSSFLDNAPTYLTFFSSALGKLGLDEATIAQALRMSQDQWGTLGVDTAKLELFVGYLKAISVGAVFMGANTYIGNAPNFMVKSIAEAGGVKMPSFFGYMAYSGLILIPIFVLVTFVFF
ncbi:MAG: sodium:proton antiporter [bacterium]|nr:sodium:proton antiporter [bacterium]